MMFVLKVVAVLAAASLVSVSADSTYEGGVSHDKVIELTVETFDKATKEDPANSLWLLKFFQTWCGHCKRLAPILDKVAPEIKGQMAIGTIDCAKQKKLCDRFKVRAYPTLKFVLDGDFHDYPSGRDEKSISQFAAKMSAPAVTLVKSYEEAIEMAKDFEDTEGVAFVGYDGEAKGEDIDKILQSTAFGQMYAQAARKQKAFAHFLWLSPVEADSENDSDEGSIDDRFKSFALPSLEADRGLRFVNRIEPKVQPRLWQSSVNSGASVPSTADFIEYISVNNIPMVATLGPSNFQKIGKNGRPLVIGVVDMSNKEQVESMKSDFATFITENPTPQSVKDKYYYGIMDGVKWFRFLEQFKVTAEDLPQIFILDFPTKEYWQNVTYATTAEKFINAVESGLIKPSSPKSNMSMMQRVLMKVEKYFLRYFPYSLIAMLFCVFGIVYLLVPSSSDLRPLPPGFMENDLQLQEEKREAEQSEATPEPTESKKEK